MYDLNPTPIQPDNIILGRNTELLRKTRFQFPQMFREGSVAGDSIPVCTTSGKPSTRLPLGGLGRLVPPRKTRFLKTRKAAPSRTRNHRLRTDGLRDKCKPSNRVWTVGVYDLNPTPIQQGNTIRHQDSKLLRKRVLHFQ